VGVELHGVAGSSPTVLVLLSDAVWPAVHAPVDQVAVDGLQIENGRRGRYDVGDGLAHSVCLRHNLESRLEIWAACLDHFGLLVNSRAVDPSRLAGRSVVSLYRYVAAWNVLRAHHYACAARATGLVTQRSSLQKVA
jgi:hypothetical protein